MSDRSLVPVVLVEGCRTPFLRSGTAFNDLTTYDLGCAAVAGLLHRTRIDPELVELLVMGRVVPDPQTTNLAREVVFGTDLSDECEAYTVTVACISSLRSTLDAVRAIQTGAVDVAIAAGAETASDAPLQFRRSMRKRLIAAGKARGIGGYLKLLRGLRPGDLLPEAIAIASDTILEGARRGKSFAEARTSVHGLFRPGQLLEGVPALLEGPHQVEALFGDGSRLVPIEKLVSP